MTAPLQTARTAPLMQIRLDRPAKLNAVSDEMLGCLKEAVADFTADRTLRVLLITAQGHYFCVGAELGTDTSPNVAANTLGGRTWYRQKWHSLFDALEAVENPWSWPTRGPASVVGWRCRCPATSA